MRTTTSSSQRNQSNRPPQAQPPSVPLSVYRQLAAELQTTKAKLESLNVQTDQLSQENRQLRQEIEQAVQCVLRLQKTVNVPPANNYQPPTPSFHVDTNRRKKPPVEPDKAYYQPTPVVEVETFDHPEEMLFTEEQEVSYRYSANEPSGSVNRLWVMLAIFLVMISAFGAGFLVVRPFLQRSR
jgi:hypothetical protein